MSKKYVVPEFILKAAHNAQLPSDNPTWSWEEADESVREFYRRILEGAFRALAEHPIVPTREQVEAIAQEEDRTMPYYEGVVRYCVGFQRRMFLAPELPKQDFGELWNALTVEINRVGIPKATEILRAQGITEPQVPEEIKDLLYSKAPSGRVGCDNPREAFHFIAESDRRVLEAFRRGQKSGPR